MVTVPGFATFSEDDFNAQNDAEMFLAQQAQARQSQRAERNLRRTLAGVDAALKERQIEVSEADERRRAVTFDDEAARKLDGDAAGVALIDGFLGRGPTVPVPAPQPGTLGPQPIPTPQPGPLVPTAPTQIPGLVPPPQTFAPTQPEFLPATPGLSPGPQSGFDFGPPPSISPPQATPPQVQPPAPPPPPAQPSTASRIQETIRRVARDNPRGLLEQLDSLPELMDMATLNKDVTAQEAKSDLAIAASKSGIRKFAQEAREAREKRSVIAQFEQRLAGVQAQRGEIKIGSADYAEVMQGVWNKLDITERLAFGEENYRQLAAGIFTFDLIKLEVENQEMELKAKISKINLTDAQTKAIGFDVDARIGDPLAPAMEAVIRGRGKEAKWSEDQIEAEIARFVAMPGSVRNHAYELSTRGLPEAAGTTAVNQRMQRGVVASQKERFAGDALDSVATSLNTRNKLKHFEEFAGEGGLTAEEVLGGLGAMQKATDHLGDLLPQVVEFDMILDAAITKTGEEGFEEDREGIALRASPTLITLASALADELVELDEIIRKNKPQAGASRSNPMLEGPHSIGIFTHYTAKKEETMAVKKRVDGMLKKLAGLAGKKG